MKWKLRSPEDPVCFILGAPANNLLLLKGNIGLMAISRTNANYPHSVTVMREIILQQVDSNQS